MKRFVATREHEGIAFGEFVDAEDYSAAQRMCRERGWVLQGECVGIERQGQIFTPAQMNALQERASHTVH